MPLIVFWVLILFQNQSFAQNSIELSCRSQAKELAVQTYQGCVTQARAQKIEEIRSEYQSKLTELKSYYDHELKSISSPNNSSDSVAPAVRGKKPEAAVSKANKKLKASSQKSGNSKKIENQNRLPEKQVASKTLPVQQAPDSSSVAVVAAESATPAPEIINAEDQAPYQGEEY